MMQAALCTPDIAVLVLDVNTTVAILLPPLPQKRFWTCDAVSQKHSLASPWGSGPWGPTLLATDSAQLTLLCCLTMQARWLIYH